MIRVLQSHRRRKRLVRVGSALLGAAVIVAAAIHYDRPGSDGAKPTPGPVQHAIVVPRTVHRSAASIDEVRAVADHFIETAVYRRHLDDAWDLAAPSMRTGVSRRQWMSGNLPVVPFRRQDVALVKWTLDYSFPRKVGLKVALIARPDAPITGLVAHMELQSVHVAHGDRWLVDAWVPLGGGRELGRAVTPIDQKPGQPVSAELGAGWVWLPLGLLVGLLLFVPLGLGVRGWVRHNRALRAYSSSSRPS